MLVKKTAIALGIIISAQSFQAQNPGAYMDKISKEFTKISEETWDYVSAVAHNKRARQIEQQRKGMLNANRSALSRIKGLPPYKDDTAYRDSTIKYLEMSYAVLNNDFSKIVDMEEIAEQSYDAMEAYMLAQEKANEKLNSAMEVAIKAQKDFADKNGITLLENNSETDQKLEKAHEVFKYYNTIYLLFFKPFKQEVYLIEAENKSDVNAMRQNQDALLKMAKDAKDKIKQLEPYQKRNATLKTTSTSVMDFYIYEAETKMPLVIDYFLIKEKFEKLRVTIEGKGKNATKEEVEEYNKAVDEFNKATDTFNKTNQELNKKRMEALEDWNNAVSKFLDRNVSKKK